MKINIEIDCTPEEARRSLGLPDVKPMQDALVAEMQEKLLSNIRGMDTEGLMRLWAEGLNASGPALDAFQKMFWGAFGGDSTGQKKD